jgi:CRISPR/Cas system-associated exonuclease Cas4 (RecB family)
MTLVGVECDKCKKKHKFLEWTLTTKCPYPAIFRKAMSFRGLRHNSLDVSVTEITGCIRSSYFKKTQEWYIDVKGLAKLWMGTAIHTACEDVYPQSEKLLMYETQNGNKLLGYMDAIDIADHDLIDIKTTYSYSGNKDEKLPQNYLMQASIYATMLKKVYGFEVRKARWPYLNISKLNSGEFMYEKEAEVFDATEWMESQVDKLVAALKKGKPPEAQPNNDSYDCKYCWVKDCDKRKNEPTIGYQ